jgi:hypothetical protein
MPRYQQATPFDIVRSVKNAQSDIRTLQVGAAPSLVRKPLNAHAASLNTNPYFWGMDPTGWAATAGTFIVVSDPPDPSPYPYAALYVNDGSGAGALMQSLLPTLIVPQQQYMVQAYVNSNVSSIQIGFDWQDGSGTPVSGPTDPSITVTPNTWTLISAIQQAPATAAFAYPRVGSPSADFAQTYVTAITSQAAAVAVQPGSSPPVVETWHNMPAMSNGWGVGTGHAKYRLTVDGMLAFSFVLTTIGTKTDGIRLWADGSLPSGYQPSIAKRWPCSITAAANSANSSPWIGILSAGGVNASGINTGGTLTELHAVGVLPLI